MLLLVALAAPAHSCSIVVPGDFVFDFASDDTVPPEAPGALQSTSVNRGQGPQCFPDGSSLSDSCDDLGRLSITFLAALDDRSPATETSSVQTGVGYRVRVVEGSLPDRLSIDEGVTFAAFAGEGTAGLPFVWIDGASDDQDAFAVTLAVKALDLAGNESGETLYEVSDPGTVDANGGEGCPSPDEPARCGTSSGAGLVGVLVGMALAARRRVSAEDDDGAGQ